MYSKSRNKTTLRYSLILSLTLFLTSGLAERTLQYLCIHESSISQAILWAQDDLDLSVLGNDSNDDVTENNSSEIVVPNEPNESPKTNNTTQSAQNRTQLIDLILASGWIGVILLLGSIIAVSLIIRICILLRRSVFLPETLVKNLSESIAAGAYENALRQARSDQSFLGKVIASGLKEADRGWNAVEKALEDSIAEETNKITRRTEPLSVIGNVAPMLGLLGTVIGMVATFGELAVADVGGRNLANGIYFALVTTVAGLLVAIPVLVAHSLLNSRLASLVSDAVEIIERIVSPLKRESHACLVQQTSYSNARQSKSTETNSTRSMSANTTTPTTFASLNESQHIQGLREVKRQDEEQPQPRPTLSLRNRRQ